MSKRRKYASEFKHEAVWMLQSPGVTVAQVASELGIGANMLGRWRRELWGSRPQAFQGNGKPRDEELAALRRELARVKRERDFFKRSGSALREGIEMRFRMIERCREAFAVRMMCRCLKVSPSGYYAWRGRPLSNRGRDNERLLERIRALHAGSDGVLGSPRMWEDLLYEGESCSLNRVARLMRAHDLRGIPQPRQWRKRLSGNRPGHVRNGLPPLFRTHLVS
jgi:putative transposase